MGPAQSRTLMVGTVLGLVLLSMPIQAQQPNDAVLETTKKATALLQVNSNRFLSALCVHDSGVFLTSYTAINGGNTLRIVQNPGTAKQAIFNASVLVQDSRMNLALLQVEGKGEFNPLPLAKIKSAEKGTEIFTAAVPNGVAANNNNYPTVKSGTGKINSIIDYDGEVRLLQVTGSTGTIGAPIVSKDGKLLGVVVASSVNSTNASVIPVNLIQKFAGKPVIDFNMPKITEVNRDEELDFVVRAVQPLTTSADPLQVELVIKALGKEHRVPMKAESPNVYKAKATPIPPELLAVPLNIELTYENGSIKGLIRDLKLNINNIKYKASDIATMKLTYSTKLGLEIDATLADGRKIQGLLQNIEGLPVILGNQTLDMKLRSVRKIAIESAIRKVDIDVSVVIKQDGIQLATVEKGVGSEIDVSEVLPQRQTKTFPFTMRAGETYVIDLESAQFDAYLRLLDSNGRQLAVDDDGGNGLNSRIIFRAPQSGTYQIIAGSLGNSGGGQYTLKARSNNPRP